MHDASMCFKLKTYFESIHVDISTKVPSMAKFSVQQHSVQRVQMTGVQLPSRTRASHLEAIQEVTAASR